MEVAGGGVVEVGVEVGIEVGGGKESREEDGLGMQRPDELGEEESLRLRLATAS